jgi:hypothetical protein
MEIYSLQNRLKLGNTALSFLVSTVIRQFSGKSPGDLVELTHRPGGAWDLYYEEGQSHVRIPPRAILAEYQSNPF